MEVLTKPLSDSKQSANEELRHALRLCVEQMCARCREAADALTASVPCLMGCETLKIAKAALDRTPMNCEALSKAEVLAELDSRSFSKEDTIEWLYTVQGATDEQK